MVVVLIGLQTTLLGTFHEVPFIFSVNNQR
ncbi:Uncharacterised protein [Riemerella anatipestifer]|nr:Uncharacterised protein [Riemerella anatipestifer]